MSDRSRSVTQDLSVFCDYSELCFVILLLFIAVLITLVKLLSCPGYLLHGSSQLWADIQF